MWFGIFLGVFFVNNVSEEQRLEITNYFSTSIEGLKQVEDLQYMMLFKDNVIKNVILAVVLWFLGTTIIGIPIMVGILIYRGFCLGYTIAASMITLGSIKGMSFILSSLVLHNIIFIPSIIAIGVSGCKLYKSIVKDRKKDKIKMEIFRHTIFSLLMLGMLLISTTVETFATTKILLIIIKYF